MPIGAFNTKCPVGPRQCQGAFNAWWKNIGHGVTFFCPRVDLADKGHMIVPGAFNTVSFAHQLLYLVERLLKSAQETWGTSVGQHSAL